MLTFIKYKNVPLLNYTSNYYPAKGGHTYQSFEEFEKLDNFDIVFLGSSHAYRGFDPRIFKKYGYSTYNLGTSGQLLESSELVYNNLIKTRKVKVIVLEVFSRTFESSGSEIESNFDIALNAQNNNICYNYILTKKDWRFVNLLFYKSFTSKSEPVYLDKTYVGSGFSENRDSVSNPNFIYSNSFNPSTEKLFVLENIIKSSKQNNQKLILVSHPLPKEYPINQHKEFVAFIQPLLEKYNIPYFDYTFKHNLKSNRHFYDYNHMNQKGVEIFDSLLINDVNFKKLLNG